MKKILLSAIVTLVLSTAVLGYSSKACYVPEKMSIWEAYGKGLVELITAGDMGEEISIINKAGMDVFIDEYAIWVTNTTQDGLLTHFVIKNYSQNFIYGSWATAIDDPYGTWVGVDSKYADYPPWWCTERIQAVEKNVRIELDGKITPDKIVEIVENDDPYYNHWQGDFGTVRNYMIWSYLGNHSSLVIGKTPLVHENTKRENYTLEISNIGSFDAENITVVDTLPQSYNFYPQSFSLKPNNIVHEKGGVTKLVWYVDKIEAHSEIIISYEMVYEEIFSQKYQRILLPRATVTWNDGDEIQTSHSAQPLVEFPCKYPGWKD